MLHGNVGSFWNATLVECNPEMQRIAYLVKQAFGLHG